MSDDKFLKNKNQLKTDALFDATSFSRYAQMFGDERAIGYLEAVADITKALNRQILFDWEEEAEFPWHRHSAYIVRTRLEAFVKEKEKFLDVCSPALFEKISKNTTQPD